jgi:uncharacterized protein YecT (DUF1311 family)
MRSILAALVALMLAATAVQAERAKSGTDKSETEKPGTDKPAARDSAKIQDCIKSAGGPSEQERCIGIVADACVKDNNAVSTADLVACAAREYAVWDDILNETFRRLRDKLDDKQKIKLRDMQRAWIESRNRTCDFYWDYHQGTIAAPMNASCRSSETARRALFLLVFLNDAEGR